VAHHTTSFLIIGQKDKLRNPELKSAVDGAIHYVNPVFISPSQLTTVRLLAATALNGRYLNAAEFGCAEAHFNARVLAQSLGADWSFVFEDDAKIEREQIFGILRAISGFDPHDPIVLLAYTGFEEDAEASNRRPSLSRISSSPSTAVVSVISIGALANIDLDRSWRYQIADWPSHFAGCDFYRISGLGVGGVDGSTIGSRLVNPITYSLSYGVRILCAPLFALLLRMEVFQFLSWFVIDKLRLDFENLIKGRLGR
jgi:hypothetical protein